MADQTPNPSGVPPLFQKIGKALVGFLMGATAAWLLFGNPPTVFLFAVIVVTGMVLLAPRRKALRRRREE